MYQPYHGYPGYPVEYGASFGAEGEAPPVESVGLDPAPLANGWLRAKLLTPDWLKQSFTIAVGVFGGLSLFRMFSHRVPNKVGEK